MLVIVVVLSTGWRYHGKPMLIVTLLVGAAAGLMGGAVQIFGPPVVLFWLSSMAAAAVVRANFVVFFAIMAAALIGTYLWFGLLTAEVIALAAFVAPAAYPRDVRGREAVPLRLGARPTGRTAYAIITLAALRQHAAVGWVVTLRHPIAEQWEGCGNRRSLESATRSSSAPARPTPRSSHRRSARRPDR